MAPTIKLTYFDIEGAGEPVRLTLALAGVDFEDHRMDASQWPEIKKTTPHGKVPVLNIDDGPMKTQSGAMMRWIATALAPEKKLYPQDKLYEIEEAIGLIDDIKLSWSLPFVMGARPSMLGFPEDYNKTEEGKAKVEKMRKDWIKNVLPTHLGYIADMIDGAGGKWIATPEEPSIADCLAVAFFRSFTKGHLDYIDTNCLEVNPKIVEYVKRFTNLPEVRGRYTNGLY